MGEVLIRLEDKNPNPKSFSQGDPVDVFDDGRFPDRVAYPHAVIKIPGYPAKDLRWVLTPWVIWNSETKEMDMQAIRLYYIDATIIDPALVAELRGNREITVDPSLINGSVRNRATGEIYNG